MKWGDKIPFESSVLISAVGNAANAAVAAARLGLSSGFISNVGGDDFGKKIIATFTGENIDTQYIKINSDLPTNHHYVLLYEAERTILIKHEAYPYTLPENLVAPKWMYLSSIGENSEKFHNDLADWLTQHPETKLAFQPGTFQIKMGKEKLSTLYAVTEVIAVNKEEAEKILACGKTDMPELLKKMHELGPKMVLITDGPHGAHVSDGTHVYKISMYPDPKPPVDRTGAGDATTSTFVAALALGKTIEEALQWGPINSMSVVQYIGAQEGLLSRESLEKLLTTAPDTYHVTTLA